MRSSVTLVLIATWFAGVISATDTGTCSFRKWNRPGTLQLRVLADIHSRDADGGCGATVSKDVVYSLVAVDWMVGILQDNDFDIGKSIFHENIERSL